MGLDDHYAAAVVRLLEVGATSVARRFASRGASLDRTPIAVAILAAVDRVDLRRAATLDPGNAVQWLAIAEDQAEISRAALTLQRVEVER